MTKHTKPTTDAQNSKDDKKAVPSTKVFCVFMNRRQAAGTLGLKAAEVQVLFVNDVAFTAIPGEYFVEFGLRIKERAYPARALVVTCANGRLGYIPTKEAFRRGGYETTFGPPSCMGSEAGDMLAEAAVELIGRGITGRAERDTS